MVVTDDLVSLQEYPAVHPRLRSFTALGRKYMD